MEKNSTWLTHNGKKILYEDYSGLSGRELVETLAANDAYSTNLQENNVPLLINFTGSLASKDVLGALKKSAQSTRTKHHKIAVIGVFGLNRFFLQTVNRFARIDARPFDTKEQALDWLTEDQ